MRAPNVPFSAPHSKPSASSCFLRSAGCLLAREGLDAKPFASQNTRQICRAQTEWVPLSVQLGSNAVTPLNTIENSVALTEGLQSLQDSGVKSMAVCVWWGTVEGARPQEYDWSAYRTLFRLIMGMGLHIQAFLCFHGDRKVPLPAWILEEGEKKPDIFYCDKQGERSFSYLTLGVDNVPVLKGRTALEAYEDFMGSFINEFQDMMGTCISEVVIGLGPDGELKYPAHPRDRRWSFPGIGEFQCYDCYMQSTLKACAEQCGHREWGISGGPRDVGDYNSNPQEARFFKSEGDSHKASGNFFLQWYAAALIKHGYSVLSRAKRLFSVHHVDVSMKLPLVHWWYDQQHAAELTAGFYNTSIRNGYIPIMSMLAELGVSLHLPGGELCNANEPPCAGCNPEMLVAQMRACAAGFEVPITIENLISKSDLLPCEQIQLLICHEGCYESIRLPQVSSILLCSMYDEALHPRFCDQVRKCLPGSSMEGCPSSFHDVDGSVYSRGFSHEVIK